MQRSARYLKVRDRASYEFALGVRGCCPRGRGRRDPRGPSLRSGGVGTRPWRLRDCEAALGWKKGRSRQAFEDSRAAGHARASGRCTTTHFKVELLPRTIVLSARNGGRGRMSDEPHRKASDPRRRPRQGHGQGALRRRFQPARTSSTPCIVSATVGLGRVTGIESAEVEGMPGVVACDHAPQRAERLAVSAAQGRHRSSGRRTPSRTGRTTACASTASPSPSSWRISMDHAERAAAALRITYEARQPIVDHADPQCSQDRSRGRACRQIAGRCRSRADAGGLLKIDENLRNRPREP